MQIKRKEKKNKLVYIEEIPTPINFEQQDKNLRFQWQAPLLSLIAVETCYCKLRVLIFKSKTVQRFLYFA